jgi:hypothetical protein
MTPQNVAAALEIMKARGIPESQAMEVLALTAQKMLDAEVLAKAQRTGRTVDEVRGADLGREIARRLNAKMHFGQKGGAK